MNHHQATHITYQRTHAAVFVSSHNRIIRNLKLLCISCLRLISQLINHLIRHIQYR